ncbi:MAG: adenylyl-sulfate kinase, partial [Oscillospiraceae bacterium]
MAYDLKEINFRTVSDAKGFLADCDAAYALKISGAADMIANNLAQSPIVLLSGPSGSGKTTTAQKLEEELGRRGIRTHTISMDNYFRTVNPATAPRTSEGGIDYESPLCMDMELLNEHFTALAEGRRICVPKYEFARQMRVLEPSKTLKLKKDELVIFEGIHALNDEITTCHPDAFKLYISARSNIEFDGRQVFKGTWMRLVRRTVRDHLFRAYPPAATIAMWANVRRGEKSYISPFKDKADLQFDTALPYELPVMNSLATELFSSIPEGIERYDELRRVLPALQLFGHIDPALVAPDSLVRE